MSDLDTTSYLNDLLGFAREIPQSQHDVPRHDVTRQDSSHNTGGTTTTTSFAYNQANQLCWQVNAVNTATCATAAPSGATSYAYDAAGNRTTGVAFDTLNRLTTLNGSALGYLTPDNTELSSLGSTSYLNDLLGLARETPQSGTAISYTRTPDGAPVAQRSTATKQYLLADRLGSITSIADDNANSLTRTTTYDPYGTPSTATTGTGSGAASNLGYAAGHTLPGGSIHYGARYYTPATGAWSQQDPLQQITSMQQANRYAYVGGDPINQVDPGGMWFGSDLYSKVKGDVNAGLDSGGKAGTAGAVTGCAAGALGAGAGCVAVGSIGAVGGGVIGFAGGFISHRVSCSSSKSC